jgi:hypothetical protein
VNDELLFRWPADDDAAIQVASWGQAVRLMVRGSQPATLSGREVNRKAVNHALALGARHLFWFGHGTDTALTAHRKPVIDASCLSRLNGGIVVAIACFAGGTLGRRAPQLKRVRAFLGFDDELGFPAAAPLPIARAVTDGLRCLFTEGHTIQCAADELRQAFYRARIDYKKNGTSYGLTDGETRTAWLFAKSNQYSVRVYGDVSVTI